MGTNKLCRGNEKRMLWELVTDFVGTSYLLVRMSYLLVRTCY